MDLAEIGGEELPIRGGEATPAAASHTSVDQLWNLNVTFLRWWLLKCLYGFFPTPGGVTINIPANDMKTFKFGSIFYWSRTFHLSSSMYKQVLKKGREVKRDFAKETFVPNRRVGILLNIWLGANTYGTSRRTHVKCSLTNAQHFSPLLPQIQQ